MGILGKNENIGSREILSDEIGNIMIFGRIQRETYVGTGKNSQTHDLFNDSVGSNVIKAWAYNGTTWTELLLVTDLTGHATGFTLTDNYRIAFGNGTNGYKPAINVIILFIYPAKETTQRVKIRTFDAETQLSAITDNIPPISVDAVGLTFFRSIRLYGVTTEFSEKQTPDETRLYWAITDEGGGDYKLRLYDADAGTEVATSAVYNATGDTIISEENSSGINGIIEILVVGDSAGSATKYITVQLPIDTLDSEVVSLQMNMNDLTSAIGTIDAKLQTSPTNTPGSAFTSFENAYVFYDAEGVTGTNIVKKAQDMLSASRYYNILVDVNDEIFVGTSLIIAVQIIRKFSG